MCVSSRKEQGKARKEETNNCPVETTSTTWAIGKVGNDDNVTRQEDDGWDKMRACV